MSKIGTIRLRNIAELIEIKNEIEIIDILPPSQESLEQEGKDDEIHIFPPCQEEEEKNTGVKNKILDLLPQNPKFNEKEEIENGDGDVIEIADSPVASLAPIDAITPPGNKLEKATTSKKAKQKGLTPVKRLAHTSTKQPPPSQTRIDNFFKSSIKSYRISPEPETASTPGKENRAAQSPSKKQKKKQSTGRKRLFEDSTTEETESLSNLSETTPPKTRRNLRSSKAQKNNEAAKAPLDPVLEACIDLCSDSDDGDDFAVTPPKKKPTPCTNKQETKTKELPSSKKVIAVEKTATKGSVSLPASTGKKGVGARKKKCPPYKIIDGTTFAVDAFQFGQIEGITHYFLTHYHADHYVGLTRKFSMPIYMSAITARLVRSYIPLNEEFLNELELNEPQVIEGVEVTAIEANHCPGAIMLVFKLQTGRCILHTGDFRANGDMESEPIFWNNDIDTIYLDTTYISDKYAFCSQYDSIASAEGLLRKFAEKHKEKRILYVCGTYVIGKEKFWSALARTFDFKVWAETNRRKALMAMQLPEVTEMLCEEPLQANLHILPLQNLSFWPLKEYFSAFEKNFDVLLAFRPSGWEKNSRPQYRGAINIVGIEYSEHSSYNELQRFVSYLKPREVISTVPSTHTLARTSAIPAKWYKYEKLYPQRGNFQPSISSFLKLKSCSDSQASSSADSSGTPTLHSIDNAESAERLQDNLSPASCVKFKTNYDAIDDWLA